MTTKPLSGLHVLDFSKVLAGPLCTQYLADMGAEVIKIEPLTGDETRGWPPYENGVAAIFTGLNRGKRSLALDLKTGDGRAIAWLLAKRSDVVIQSFGGGVADRLGLGETELRGHNPSLIYCSISGFGTTGSMSEAPAYDAVLQAFTGIMAITGEEGQPMIRSPISPIDQTTGLHALSGILAALYERERTGEARSIEVSLFETAVGLLGPNVHNFWASGQEPRRWGSSHESLCPYKVFDAADGPILIAIANDNLWRRFCAVVGLEGLASHPDFRTNSERVARREETNAHVQNIISREQVGYWMAVLSAAKIPCSAINSVGEMLRHPHTRASGIVMHNRSEEAPNLRCIAHPVRFPGIEREIGPPPPHLSEDGPAILAELGFSGDDIIALRLNKVTL